MENTNIPPNVTLPSKRTLMQSTILAIGAAITLFFTVILPAEYGIDYTGVGNILGLTRMGEIKASLAAEAKWDHQMQHESAESKENTLSQKVEHPAVSAPDTQVTASVNVNIRSDSVTISLQPDEGKEIKLIMNKGHKVEYVWWSDGGKVIFDTHADSKPLNIEYHSYEKGSEQSGGGILEAAFDGSHGWFWRNRNANTVNVTLHVKGAYSELKHLY